MDKIALGAKLELVKRYFFDYCHLIMPSFYKPDRDYLVSICGEFQSFLNDDEHDVLVLNMPPRHGKSLTLGRFVEWILGNDHSKKIMTGSYNETLSTVFSKNVRNTIQEVKADKDMIVYSDIFDAKIKYGDGAMNLWSLEDGYNNYLATSPTGTATGFGADIIIIDDVIKNADEANNAAVLDKHWEWFVNTMLSRLESNGKIIINMTRWHSNDLAGRALKELPLSGYKVKHINFQAYDEKNDRMLCEDVLSYEDYLRKAKTMGADIASANYQQEPIDIKGRLYGEFKTYSNRSAYKKIWHYCDTADTGKDYLCSIVWGETLDGYQDVLDVIYTQQPMEYTESAVANQLINFKVNTSRIERNNGGRSFAREGDVSNIRLTNAYVPGGNIVLSTVRPSPTAINIWHTIRGTQIVTYTTTLPQQWYVVLQDVTASSRIKGKISLRNIKIEEGAVATPYQPNLLVEPYHISKIPLNENLANKEQAFPINRRQYLVYSAEMIEPLIANQTYILTLKGTKLGPQSFRVYTTGPNNTSNIGDMEIVEGLADTWRLTFTPTSANLNGSVSPSTLQIYQFPQATMGQVTIDSLKIEKGDIATPNISEHRYFGEGIKDSNNPNDYSWDITEEYIERRIADHIDKSEKEQEKLFLTKTEASTSLMDLTTPQTVSALKKFNGGLLSNGINVGVEYGEAVTTDKYDNHGAVYLGGGVWLTWETLSFSNPSGWGRGSTIRVGNDGHPGFTYPDVPNIFGGYIWIGGSCLPDYTDGGFGAYHITVSNNFDDARQPIVRFIDSPTTPVKRLAVRGFALVFAPALTTNSKVQET